MDKKQIQKLFRAWQEENRPDMPLDMRPGYLLAFAAGVYAAEEAQAEKVCRWQYDHHHDSWLTDCGNLHTFLADGPRKNNYTFCPYCGGRIDLRP